MEQVRLLLAEHATLDEGFIQGVAGFLVGIAVRAPAPSRRAETSRAQFWRKCVDAFICGRFDASL